MELEIHSEAKIGSMLGVLVFFFEVEEVLTLDFHYPNFSPKGKKTLSDEIITTSPRYHQR